MLCIMVLSALSLAIAYYGSSRCTECVPYVDLSTHQSAIYRHHEGGERNDVNCTVDLCRINFAPVPWKANPVARCNGDMRACVTFFCKTFGRLLLVKR